MRYPVYFFLIVVTFFLSCKFDSVKPSSSGKSGELVVVIDSLLWKNDPGKVLRDTLLDAVPGIPQYEPFITTVNVHPNQFKNILRHHRNVLMVETGPVTGNKNYALTLKRNVWAEPQLVLNLRAKDAQALEIATREMSATIRERFLDEDRLRISEGLQRMKRTPVADELKLLTGINMPVPREFFIALKEPPYTWIRKETANTSLGLQLYRFPYVSDSSFSAQFIINLRDSLSKKHIPGPVAGSYMTTDRKFPLTIETFEINKSFTMQIRGLWRTEGDFMGGPFLSYLIYNRNRSELLYIDYYIYAPKFNKREYVRDAEALISALTFE